MFDRGHRPASSRDSWRSGTLGVDASGARRTLARAAARSAIRCAATSGRARAWTPRSALTCSPGKSTRCSTHAACVAWRSVASHLAAPIAARYAARYPDGCPPWCWCPPPDRRGHRARVRRAYIERPWSSVAAFCVTALDRLGAEIYEALPDLAGAHRLHVAAISAARCGRRCGPG